MTTSVRSTARQGPVCVVGSGTMGAGIAQIAAVAGHPVLLIDANLERAEKAVALIAEQLQREVSKDRLSKDDAAAATERIRSVHAIADLAKSPPCVLAIEAVVEGLDVKRSVLEQLEAVVTDSCLVATNTSSLSITRIGRGLRLSERFVGMHFFNPVPRMRLVEIVTGLATTPSTAATATSYANAWGKTTVQVCSTPGFIVNRVARPFYGEALRLLDERAASPATIDAVLRDAGGFRMGPFELTDLIGQDVNEKVTRTVWKATGNDPRYAPSVSQVSLIDAGWWGRKTGRGFFRYDPAGARRDTPAAVSPAVSLAEVVVRGDVGSIEPILRRSGLPLTRSEGPGFVELPGGAVMLSTDGSLATAVAAQLHRPVVLLVLDRCLDPDSVTRIAVAPSDAIGSVALAETAGLLAAAGITASVIDDAPGLIAARTVAMLVNEAFDGLHRGTASESDIDLAMRLGTNYPLGPFAWAERWGHASVVTILDNLAAVYGDGRYRVSPLLRRRALTTPTTASDAP